MQRARVRTLARGHSRRVDVDWRKRLECQETEMGQKMVRMM